MIFHGSPGLVLPGGGARAAYQVGVLKAIASLMEHEPLPFPAIAGISAGSINAAIVAQEAGDFVGAVQKLEALWVGIRSTDVYHVEIGGLRSLAKRDGRRTAFFDNGPLVDLLDRHFDAQALAHSIAAGPLRGLAVTASSTSTGEAVTFMQAAPDTPVWHHERRDSQLTRLGPEHLLASSALPLLFPPARVGESWYVDGSLRMTAPLSPVINLGADRILVIGVRHEADAPPDLQTHTPSLGEIGGYTLESLFAENLNVDIERARQINDMLARMPWWRRRSVGRQHIEIMVIRPSQDVRDIAARFSASLPRSIRLFLRTLGGWGGEWRLPSYLLFEGSFAKALIDLGYRDGLKQRREIEAFFASPRRRGFADRSR